MSQWNKIVYIKHYGDKTNKYENQDEHRQKITRIEGGATMGTVEGMFV